MEGLVRCGRRKVWRLDSQELLPELKNRYDGQLGRESCFWTCVGEEAGLQEQAQRREGPGQALSLWQRDACGRQSGESPWRQKDKGRRGRVHAPFSHQISLEIHPPSSHCA